MGGKHPSYCPGADCVAQEIKRISTDGKKNGSQSPRTESPWLATVHRSLRGDTARKQWPCQQTAGRHTIYSTLGNHQGFLMGSVTIHSQQQPSPTCSLQKSVALFLPLAVQQGYLFILIVSIVVYHPLPMFHTFCL